MTPIELIDRILLWIIPAIFAITLHEVAHGISAYFLGDSTAKSHNRLSINPIRHIDPIGSIAVPVILLSISNFMFGWAKPVPVVFSNLNNPKRDMIIVAFAGPFANLLMALFWVFCFKLGINNTFDNIFVNDILIYTGAAGVLINTALMMLNLLPILPLDGGRILNGLLPDSLSFYHAKTEVIGLPLLILLILSNTLLDTLQFLITTGLSLFVWIAQIPGHDLNQAILIMMGY